MRNLILIILIESYFLLKVNSQEIIDTPGGCFFIEPGFSAGQKVANYSSSPDAGYSRSFDLSLGTFHNNQKNSWASFYNYPFTGVTMSFSNLGNDLVFGNQYTLMPFIVFNTSNKLRNSVYFKLGLGCSHFTRYYDESENPVNKEIGSGYTWSFQSFIYYSLFVSEYASINIGGGYLHSSNGHIQLPNFGMNQAVLSVTAKYFPGCINPDFKPKSSKLPVNRERRYYLMVRNGLGIHEYGSASGPVGGPKRLVKSASLAAGVILRDHIKLDAGFAGRFYEHYYQNIISCSDSLYLKKPELNASNLYFFIGVEFLAGHIGMDIEGGLNLFKPYFKTHYETMEGEIDLDYWLKQLFNSRLGLNLYLINTDKKPRNNVYIGVNINANFGQADFSALCIGVTHCFSD